MLDTKRLQKVRRYHAEVSIPSVVSMINHQRVPGPSGSPIRRLEQSRHCTVYRN